jgi:hypothetical protein
MHNSIIRQWTLSYSGAYKVVDELKPNYQVVIQPEIHEIPSFVSDFDFTSNEDTFSTPIASYPIAIAANLPTINGKFDFKTN